jgi:hypothetical protein
MPPILLDALTIIFIVGGLVLLWQNLRGWRRRTVPVAPPKQADYTGERKPRAPTEMERTSAPERLVSDAEIARARAQAEECLEQAERSTSEADKETWLAMAGKWIKLIEDAEQQRGSGK